MITKEWLVHALRGAFVLGAKWVLDLAEDEPRTIIGPNLQRVLRNAGEAAGKAYPDTLSFWEVDSETKRPPMGIVPEVLHEGMRIQELGAAISRYSSNADLSNKENIALIETWCAELSRRLGRRISLVPPDSK